MARNMSRNGIKEKKPSFFQILLPGYNTEHLGIPPKFMKHINHELSERATLKLKVSSDCSWSVKVRKTEKGVYFKDGWQEFLKDNSLGDSEFLVFSYEEKLHFSIEVFDKSACERVSVPNIRAHRSPTIANTSKRPRGRPRKHPVPVSSSKPSRPSKTSTDDSDESLPSSESSELEVFNEEEEDSEDDKTEDSEAAAEPESFKSKFPHFGALVRRQNQLFVPTAFSRKHFPQRKYFEIILKIAGGKEWGVKAIPAVGSHFLSAGWSEFASANRITVGDTIILELVSTNKMLVHILH